MEENENVTKWILGVLSFLSGCTVGQTFIVARRLKEKKAKDEAHRKHKIKVKKKEAELVLDYQDLIFMEDDLK